MYVCWYACICIMHVHMNAYTFVLECACMSSTYSATIHTYIYTHIHAHIQAHATIERTHHLLVNKHGHIIPTFTVRLPQYLYLYVCLPVCMCACMHTYVYMHTYSFVEQMWASDRAVVLRTHAYVLHS